MSPSNATKLGVTANHPHYSETRHAWIPAGDLQLDEVVRTLNGHSTLTARTQRPTRETVFNLEVHSSHAYHVSGLALLAHNTGLPCPVAGGGARFDNLPESTRARIQAFVDKHQSRVTVVGSRAGGTAGPRSDFDYLIGGNSRLRQRARQELPRGAAGGEIGPRGETGMDIFNENIK